MSKKPEFKVGERVVYPSHGVGEIIEIESQAIGEIKLEVYVISFPHDKMTLRVPVSRATASGLRTLATKSDVNKVYSILNDKPKRGNKMWSRRAQEYETKINSGQIEAIAEVVRDLYKNVDNDRSYSERTIYESALNRLATEIAVLENITIATATEKLVELLREKLAAA
ncbi:CarD family transcriptional regulator [Candidatus Megaera venefica]|jgi:CarD family transcriptional regulator|uniref:CarD family transcriptional regulator n=1 Tax=Candidatus Megaera venefica TaxID=2055910 RepID=A0ABU5NBD6_9RICK|nr:CarD family transcriptional regulator [Candidatus Megaera venefica]MBY0534115.1 CarD family transcriptional regulator [Rickettsiaceae bacterium]MEA0970461.1 CarD family transcriptional regulator [Candidatus Megaera venefica]